MRERIRATIETIIDEELRYSHTNSSRSALVSRSLFGALRLRT
jgi:hypothetical protein